MDRTPAPAVLMFGRTVLGLATISVGLAGVLLWPSIAERLLSDDGSLREYTQSWLRRYSIGLLFFALGLGLTWAWLRFPHSSPTKARFCEWLAKWALAAAASIATILFVELLLCIAGSTQGSAGTFAEYSAKYLDEIRPQLNSDGFRDAEFEPRADSEEFRALVFGDSFVFGFGLHEPEQTFPAKLQSELRASGPGQSLRTFNAAIPGSDTSEQIGILKRTIPLVDPDLIVWGYHFNDIESRTQKIQYLRQNRLVPIVSDFLLRHSRVWSYVEPRLVSCFGLEQSYPDHLQELYRAQAMERHAEELLHLQRIADRSNVPIAVVLFPLLERLENYPMLQAHQVMQKQLDGMGLVWLDLLSRFAGQQAAELHVSELDHHLNEAGLEDAAAATAQFLREARLVPDPDS